VDDSLQGLTALVVDDDADIRKLIARILRLAGAKVSVTGSVEDALQLLEENRWDVVVTDIGMPRLSGYDLIRRAHQRGHRIPIIAVTAFDTPDHRRQIFRHGFAYHLTKPFDPDHLVAVVGETARNGRRAAPALTHDTKTSVGSGVCSSLSKPSAQRTRTMGTARTYCPDCESRAIVDLADILPSPRVDYFRCCDCLCWWFVPKGADEPATRAVFGNLNASAVKNKAG
jgi:CheY-like chemotaxis protein